MLAAHGSISWHETDRRDAGHVALLGWEGRLDNREDLLARLGCSHAGSVDDATLVLSAYRRWGISGLGQVIGDWSVVMRDDIRGAVVLASDYAGVRPLYYSCRRGGLDWAFRLGVLADAKGIDDLDEQYIAGFLIYGGCPNHTPYVNVRSVPPGHAVCVTRDGASAVPFWTSPIRDQIRFRDERRYDEQFRALFRQAVAVRLREPGPVLAELSGGLDSSSVVCMANGLIRRGEVATRELITISYVHRDSLDATYIREVERACGIEGVHVSLKDHPLMSAHEVGTVVPEAWAPVHRAVDDIARQRGATLLLTGHNGDLVTGNWYDDSLQVAAALRRGRLRQASREALEWSKLLHVPMASVFLRAIGAVLPTAFTTPRMYALEGISRSGPARMAEHSVAREFCKRTGVTEPDRLFSTEWMQAPPERRKHFHALTTLRELRALQPAEPNTCVWSHPFAHRPLVEFMMSVPADVLCRPGEPRRLMRRALADLWPEALRKRRSKGLFGVPWHEALKPLAITLLESAPYEIVERGWVDCASFRSRLGLLLRGVDCNEAQLRRLILLECWLRNRLVSRRDMLHAS